jgi:hypothetical protein
MDRVTLLVNDPITDADAMYYGKKINTKKDATLFDLKQSISAEFGLPIDSFYLMRMDKDLKEMKRTIEQHGLCNNSMIKVKLGTPRHEGSYEVNLVLVNLRKGLPDSEII